MSGAGPTIGVSSVSEVLCAMAAGAVLGRSKALVASSVTADE